MTLSSVKKKLKKQTDNSVKIEEVTIIEQPVLAYFSPNVNSLWTVSCLFMYSTAFICVYILLHSKKYSNMLIVAEKDIKSLILLHQYGTSSRVILQAAGKWI